MTSNTPKMAPQSVADGEECVSGNEFPPTKNASTLHWVVSSLLTSLLLWLSFPPVGWWPLAWLAPVPLIYLVSLPQTPQKHLRWIWLSGFCYWMMTFYFVPLPHPALYAGWVVLSVYLSLYHLVFFVSARHFVHRWNISIVFAIPVCWTGTEFLRCNLLTGMGLVCLSHSQFEQTLLIQCADLFGAYTLTYVMITVSAAIVAIPWGQRRFPRKTRGFEVWVGFGLLTALLLYGGWRLSSQNPASTKIKIGIIQGSIDTRLNAKAEVQKTKFDQYTQLTRTARAEHPDLDVVLWPENGLPSDVLDYISTRDAAEDAQLEEQYQEQMELCWQFATGYGYGFDRPVPMILGGISVVDEADYYNAALSIDENGQIVDRYFKNHLVMYGEYFPILNAIPGIQQYFSGMSAGVDAGAFLIDGIKLAPLICFETTVPHFARRQLNRLASAGDEPDAIINLTNDGWFFGTACLDFHLACNVLRAVENRKPNIVCANTGFSAHIDRDGRLVSVGPRRNTAILTAEVGTHQVVTLYRKAGDLVWLACAIALVVALIHARSNPHRPKNFREESAITRTSVTS